MLCCWYYTSQHDHLSLLSHTTILLMHLHAPTDVALMWLRLHRCGFYHHPLHKQALLCNFCLSDSSQANTVIVCKNEQIKPPPPLKQLKSVSRWKATLCCCLLLASIVGMLLLLYYITMLGARLDGTALLTRDAAVSITT